MCYNDCSYAVTAEMRFFRNEDELLTDAVVCYTFTVHTHIKGILRNAHNIGPLRLGTIIIIIL